MWNCLFYAYSELSVVKQTNKKAVLNLINLPGLSFEEISPCFRYNAFRDKNQSYFQISWTFPKTVV